MGAKYGICAMVLLLSSAGAAIGQQSSIKELLPGAWSFVSAVAENPDGTKTEPFGAGPKGIIIFTADGHFALFQSHADVPKIAANDRAKTTPEEALGVVRTAIAYYGAYSISETEKTLMVRINGSTFANLIGGPEQKRIITSLTAEELKFTNPRTPAGVTLQTVWERAKAP